MAVGHELNGEADLVLGKVGAVGRSPPPVAADVPVKKIMLYLIKPNFSYGFKFDLNDFGLCIYTASENVIPRYCCEN